MPDQSMPAGDSQSAPNVALAHTNGAAAPHLLEDHLLAVAKLAAEKAASFNSSEWASLAGKWHDLGKYRTGFQRYIRQCSDENAHIEGRVAGAEKTHSAAGAVWAINTLSHKHGESGRLVGRVFAYLVASHHAGLYDWYGGLDARLSEENTKIEYEEALDANPPAHILDAGDFRPNLLTVPGGGAGFALWVRMLFSCLVDADFLDTEAFFDTQARNTRVGFPAVSTLLPVFETHMRKICATAPPSLVNGLRASILRQCSGKANLAPGFFSLTVPTGGGKTLASLGFALTHANTHGKRRIIYAIPYTSIIEQTADVFREVFASLGEDVLIEHHSQADADESKENARSRLACENWDAPLIVTTNVQLFESLFAAKTSRCRKLHSLVNSVIVLDEAQQLPPHFLQPILDVLNLLVAHYGVTVVLCTATQPALSSTTYFDASRGMRGLNNVREIIDDPDALFIQLKRVTVELPSNWNVRTDWPTVAAAVAQDDCVLVIVNTRNSARQLHSLLPKGTLHLSALMCGAHRSKVINQIKARLAAKRAGQDHEPLRVVSTQLVEAGVDLDFPVVWRAVAGLDSIAQAAGRCNREGLLSEHGRVVVFVSPDDIPSGVLRKAADTCISTLHGCDGEPLTRPLFERYFRQFYYAVDLDKACITPLLKDGAKTLGVQFRSAANAFRLIDDENQATVVVRYRSQHANLEMLLGMLDKDGPQRWLMRKLQRFTITINKYQAEKLLGCGLSLVMPGLYVQDVDDMYDDDLGFLLDSIPNNPAAYVS
jgi:CRISPR-associated endonuclease/helicase Cas3